MTNTIAGVLCTFLVFGCQNGVAPPTQEPDGLTMFSADRSTGLTGMFKDGDQVVFFETITDPPNEPGDHRASHGQEVLRPMFSARWSDAEGRTISVDLSGSTLATTTWTDVSPDLDRAPPEHWDALLDLTKQAGLALEARGVDANLREEQAQLVLMANLIPEADARSMPVTDEQLAEIAARQSDTRGYLGYSWFQQFWVNEAAFHQCTGWDNYRLVSGTWRVYNSAVQNNGANCDHTKCGKVSGHVQDYKGWLDQCDGGASAHYGACDFTKHKYNCRSSALREQTYVLGNKWCSGSSQATGTMCEYEEDNFGGAYCGWHTTCSNVNVCY